MTNEQPTNTKRWQFRIRSFCQAIFGIQVITALAAGAFGDSAQNVVLNALLVAALVPLFLLPPFLAVMVSTFGLKTIVAAFSVQRGDATH